MTYRLRRNMTSQRQIIHKRRNAEDFSALHLRSKRTSFTARPLGSDIDSEATSENYVRQNYAGAQYRTKKGRA